MHPSSIEGQTFELVLTLDDVLLSFEVDFVRRYATDRFVVAPTVVVVGEGIDLLVNLLGRFPNNEMYLLSE